MSRRWILVGATLALHGLALAQQPPGGRGAGPAEYPGELASSWNERVLRIANDEDHFLTLKGIRAAAMMHLAMHDALNTAQARFATFGPAVEASDAHPLAAAAQAAYEVAASQYPGHSAELARELARWTSRVANGPAKSRGLDLGRAAATAVLRAREGDGWDARVEYRFQPMAPGVYAEFREHSGTPEGFVFGSGWAKARPFFLRRADQFRAAPPPEIRSTAYARAFDEVKEIGRAVSRVRTPDQTHLAFWWKEFCESSMNRLARQLVAAERLDLWEATRLFALVDATLFDAYVSVFENKFHFNHWRPYTAIRRAEHDGNPATQPELDWDNTHRHTYAFPSYPSAHGTACAAATTIFARTFGDDTAFTLTTSEVNSGGPMSPMIRLDPPTRSFTSFSAAARECALSRVYLGIHFRYDAEAGSDLGRRIAEHAWDHFLTPRPAATP